jgi:hypothetical protein
MEKKKQDCNVVGALCETILRVPWPWSHLPRRISEWMGVFFKYRFVFPYIRQLMGLDKRGSKLPGMRLWMFWRFYVLAGAPSLVVAAHVYTYTHAVVWIRLKIHFNVLSGSKGHQIMALLQSLLLLLFLFLIRKLLFIWGRTFVSIFLIFVWK